MTLRMADATDPASLPAGWDAYAGYVDGRWPDYQAIAAARQVPVLGIAVFASDDAECCDVENTDLTAAQVPAWVTRQQARGVARPVVYASVRGTPGEGMPDVLAALSAARIPRQSVRLWSAHYEAGEHICGPASCGLIAETMDGTQWAAGAYDASILSDDFFDGTPNWQEDMMRQLPELSKGATGPDVGTIQGLCIARLRRNLGTTGPARDGVDNDFGEITRQAVVDVQKAAGFTPAEQDGIVGPQTWPALLGA